MQKFHKYQGTGNDFILIDNRNDGFKKNKKTIAHLCDRRFGIGADGLILLEKPEQIDDDFNMVYFNADGQESSMCGNGGRCIVKFAQSLGVVKHKAVFSAIDGKHEAIVENDIVRLKMSDVEKIETDGEAFLIDTGSPHYITFVEDVNQIDVRKEGAKIRNSKAYREEGINVNFVEIEKGYQKIRTYERGVEDETFSCGTGVTAAALALSISGKINKNEIELQTLGGKLSVSFQNDNGTFKNVWLNGPAKKTFEGDI